MFEWLFLLFAPLPVTADAPTSAEYYVGLVAAEAAYATLQPSGPVDPAPPTPPAPVDPKNCPTCKNSGRPGWVRTGDGQGWTKCPTCQPVEATVPTSASVGWPPKPRNDCPAGVCPPSSSPRPASAGGITPVTASQAR